MQNNRVDNNAAKGCMRMSTSRDDNPDWWLRSVPVALHDLGCRTGLFGKVLNVMKTYGCDAGGEGDRLPPGVSRQSIMCKIEYYNATFAEGDDAVAGGAVTVRTTGSLPTDYSTSIVGNASVAFVRDALANHSAQPFFVWIGPHAPHLPSTPAPWYATDPIGLLEPPREAYFNASGAHRHAFLPDEPTINADDWAAIKTEYSIRMRSLLSVDDIVREIARVLTAHAAWSAYFLYLSATAQFGAVPRRRAQDDGVRPLHPHPRDHPRPGHRRRLRAATIQGRWPTSRPPSSSWPVR